MSRQRAAPLLRLRSARDTPWRSARLHSDVIHEGGLGALLRAVPAPDPAQFLGDLRPVPVRVVAAFRADDLVRAFGRLVPRALTRRAIDQFPPAQAHERGAIVVTRHGRSAHLVTGSGERGHCGLEVLPAVRGGDLRPDPCLADGYHRIAEADHVNAL